MITQIVLCQLQTVIRLKQQLVFMLYNHHAHGTEQLAIQYGLDWMPDTQKPIDSYFMHIVGIPWNPDIIVHIQLD